MAFDSMRRRLAGWLAPETRDLSAHLAYMAAASSRATLSGTPVNARSALSVAAVYQAVQIYTSTLGSMSPYIAEVDDRGGRRPASYHPAYRLVNKRPNGYSTSMRFRQAWIGHALTFGNGYAEIIWDRRGRTPLELHLIDPREIEPIQAGGTVVYRQKGGRPDLPMEDVLHLAMFGFDGVKGYSPIAIGAETIGVAAAQRDYQAGLFKNSAGMRGHLEIPGSMKADAKANMQTEWDKKHAGVKSAGMTGILDGGAKWVTTSFSPQDAELILGAKFSVEEIARIFNLPPHKLGILANASYSTVEQANIDFFQTSVFPWLTAIEQEYDLKVFGRIEQTKYFVTHDFSTLLKGDTAARSTQEKSDLATGVQSINEIRVSRGLDVIEDPRADFHWVPTNNLSPIELMPKEVGDDEAGDPAEPAEPDEPDADDAPGPDLRPPATTPPRASAASLRDALIDPVARSIRRLGEAARRASKRDGFAEWIGAYQEGHSAFVVEAIRPTFRSLSALTGRECDPSPFGRDVADDAARQLRELADSTPPGELAAAVDQLCSTWEAGRASTLIDDLINTLDAEESP